MSEGRVPWQKKLYANGEYPDNYTDRRFLEELRRGRGRSGGAQLLLGAVLGSGLVAQQLCLVVLFCLAFARLYDESLAPQALLAWSTLASSIGYAGYWWKVGWGRDAGRRLMRHGRAVGLFLLLAHALSPVLQTLTRTVSTDTVFSTTLVAMLLHLALFDYGVRVLIVSSSFSTNAAVFASVTLASRLPSPLHATALLAASAQCFILCPLLLSTLQSPPWLQLALVLVTTSLLAALSLPAALHFICLILFITVLCPVLFVRWQVYKENIYGPWDEAVVTKVSINS